MCEHTYLKQKEAKEMTLEQFKYIINQIPSLPGFPRLLVINLTGLGENLVNKDFLEMVKFLEKKVIYVTFADNFTLLTEDVAKTLILANVNKIFVSLDGATKKTYEKMRVGANFEEVLKNIRNFVELKNKMKKKNPDLIIRFVPTNQNIREMPLMVELAHKLGIKKITIPPFYVSENNYFLEIGEAEFNKFKTESVKLAKKLKIKLEFQDPDKKPITQCIRSFGSLFITQEGLVLPCCYIYPRSNHEELEAKHNFGNVFKQSIREIWTSDKYKKFRKLIRNGKAPYLCNGCHAFYAVR